MPLPPQSRGDLQVEQASTASIPADTTCTAADTVPDTGLIRAMDGSIAGDGQDDNGSVAATEARGVAGKAAEDKKQTTKATARRRKRAAPDPAPGELTAKKLRGTRGRLVGLLQEFPEEMFNEVLSYLDPVDLLHMARATRKMRNLLMSKESRVEWKRARGNIPGLPDCPDDLSEPQYANLVFEKYCHFCLRHLGNAKIYWTSRVRICNRCFDGKFDTANDDLLKLPESVRPYVPHFDRLIGRSPRTYVRSYYYLAVERKWIEEYEMTVDKEKWAQDKIEAGKKIMEHSEVCEAWYNEYQKKCEEERAALIQARIDKVSELLREMGWGTELDDMEKQSAGKDKLEKYPPLYKACQKELTDRITQNLLPILGTFMEGYKERRLQRMRVECLKMRVQMLANIIKSYRSTTIRRSVITLDIGNIYIQPEVLELLLSSSDPEDVGPNMQSLYSRFPEMENQIRRGIEDQLIEMVEDFCGYAHGLDRSTLLNLATTTFRCQGSCASKLGTLDVIRYPRVAMHQCAFGMPDSWPPANAHPDLKTLAAGIRMAPWNMNSRISFDEETYRVLSHVVTLCGFDFSTTTASRMDQAAPVIECISCNNIHVGRMVMRWDAVPAHVFECHKRQWENSMRLTVLQGDIANILRDRLNEEYLKKRASDAYIYMACAYCPAQGNLVKITQHVQSSWHGITKPSEAAGDFVCLLDAPTLSITYRAWPPRDEDELPAPDPSPTSSVFSALF